MRDSVSSATVHPGRAEGRQEELPRVAAGSCRLYRHHAEVIRPSCLVVLVGVLTACGGPAYDEPGEVVPATRIGTAPEATRRLAGLRVEPRARHRDRYSRSAFGQSWSDTDGNGCNQRDDVLLRDAVPGSLRLARQGSCDHDVIAGAWVDPYTARALRFDDLKDPVQAQGIQIDHVVPLAEAWASGAASWSFGRRRSFANDLAELLAVDGPTNAAKSDGDPAAWRPPKRAQCTYAIRWIGIKHTWDLATDASETRALGEMLDRCPG